MPKRELQLSLSLGFSLPHSLRCLHQGFALHDVPPTVVVIGSDARQVPVEGSQDVICIIFVNIAEVVYKDKVFSIDHDLPFLSVKQVDVRTDLKIKPTIIIAPLEDFFNRL